MIERSAPLAFTRHPIEIESPEERGYGSLRCNLTESSFTDGSLEEFGVVLANLTLCYGDHRGNNGLREIIAASTNQKASNASNAENVSVDEVIITPGAAAALYFAYNVLIGKGDHVVIERTNYATNITTPRILGADISDATLTFDSGYRLDIDQVERLVRPDTKLISVTSPHNPTGTALSEPELRRLCEIAERCGAFLLVDETYRDFVAPTARFPLAATLYKRAISVSSVSKAYGLPGLRVGWSICRDPSFGESMLAAKEQIAICGSTLDEEAARQVLVNADVHRDRIAAEIERKRELVLRFFDDQQRDSDNGGPPDIEWVEPTAGVVCFPRLSEHIDVDAFYQHLNGVEGTFVGDGHWFETDRRYFRLGFGWPSESELADGLEAISRSLMFARSR